MERSPVRGELRERRHMRSGYEAVGEQVLERLAKIGSFEQKGDGRTLTVKVKLDGAGSTAAKAYLSFLQVA
jgi:hypothetical protein